MGVKNKPGVLILGGDANTTSLVRSLGRRHIKTIVSGKAGCPALKSRFCTQSFTAPDNAVLSDFWFDLLLSGINTSLHGNVIMTGSDEAVEFVAENKEALKQNYLVDDSVPELQLAMLDKQQTIELGRSIGCPIPEFWHVQSLEDVVKIKDQVMYPAMIKPVHSHLFQPKFHFKKYLLANNSEELIHMAKQVINKDLKFMVCEFIPGPDSQASSYHTYIDENGEKLFEYTHKIVRRYPENEGNVCFNITEWLPETAEMGKRFFDGIGFRGMGHIEFKRDARDGKLKIIECNPRFSACQAIVLKSGLDMGYLIYCKLTGNPLPEKPVFKNGVRRWSPVSDLLAFQELYEKGEITISEWIRSIAGLPIAFPYFDLLDPGPFVQETSSLLSGIVRRKFSRQSEPKKKHKESHA